MAITGYNTLLILSVIVSMLKKCGFIPELKNYFAKCFLWMYNNKTIKELEGSKLAS